MEVIVRKHVTTNDVVGFVGLATGTVLISTGANPVGYTASCWTPYENTDKWIELTAEELITLNIQALIDQYITNA